VTAADARLRDRLLHQHAAAVIAMREANLLNDEEAAGMISIANGLAMDRVADKANTDRR